MKKQVIHAANIWGIEELFKNENEGNYLCCSNIGCKDYFHRDVLFSITGKVVREFTGDIGSIGMSAKNTDYDEVHVEGEYVIDGLYIPENMEYFDLYNYAKAKSFINCVLELPIEIMNANEEQLKIISKFEEEIENLSEEEYRGLMGLE